MGCFAVPLFFMPVSLRRRSHNPPPNAVISPENTPWYSPPQQSRGFIHEVFAQIASDTGVLFHSLTDAKRHVVRVIGRLFSNLRYLPAFAVTTGFVWLLLRFAGPPRLRLWLPLLTNESASWIEIYRNAWPALLEIAIAGFALGFVIYHAGQLVGLITIPLHKSSKISPASDESSSRALCRPFEWRGTHLCGQRQFAHYWSAGFGSGDGSYCPQFMDIAAIPPRFLWKQGSICTEDIGTARRNMALRRRPRFGSHHSAMSSIW